MSRKGLENEYQLERYLEAFPPKLLPVYPIWEPPADLIPKDRKSGDFLNIPKNEVRRLIKNPPALTYMSLLPLELLERKYPRIMEGRYLPDVITPPSRDTEIMLKYFGAKNSEDLLKRAKNITRAIFKTGPKDNSILIYPPRSPVDNIFTAFDFINELHGRETRYTGESKICHEVRIHMRGLAKLVNYHETSQLLADTYYPRGYHPGDPLSPFNHAQALAGQVGIVMHDSREDYFDLEKANLGFDLNTGPPYIVTLKHGASKRYLAFTTRQEVASMIYAIDAFTNNEQNPLYTDEFSTRFYLYDLLGAVMDLGSGRENMFLKQLIYDGKAFDREDNICMLWKHERDGPKGDRYKTKLVESMSDLFQLLASGSWFNRHSTEITNNLGFVYKETRGDTWLVNYIQDVPPISATVLLKLLGGTDDDILGWTTRGRCKKYMTMLEKAGKEPLLVPSPTQADIFANDGTHLVISRNGSPTTLEVVKALYGKSLPD